MRKKAAKERLAQRPLAKLAALVDETAGHPGPHFLTVNEHAEFAFKPEFSAEHDYEPLRDCLIATIRNEFVFARRHLPFAQQWALSDEGIVLSEIMADDFLLNGFDVKATNSLLADFKKAARLQTPRELHEVWGGLVQTDAELCRLESWLDSLHLQRRIGLFTIVVGGIDGVLKNVAIDGPPIGPIGSQSDVDAIFSFVLKPGKSITAAEIQGHIFQVAQLIRLAKRDTDVARYLLKFACQLPDVAADQEEAELLELLCVALVVSLPGALLRELVVTQNDRKWIEAHIFALVGALRDVTWCDFSIDDEDIEIGLRRADFVGTKCSEYIQTAQGQAVARKLLAAVENFTVIQDWDRRIEQLVNLEEELHTLDSTIDFAEMPLVELLQTFVPQTRQESAVTHLPESRALTFSGDAKDGASPSGQEAGGKTPPAVQAVAVAGLPEAAHAPALAPEETLAHWQAVWMAFKGKHAACAKAVAARQAQPPLPDLGGEMKHEGLPAGAGAASDSGRRQPGSRPRPTGYNHHLPTGDRHLPKAVVKARMQAILERKGAKYTKGMRDEVLERIHAKTVEVAD